jgi:hypothetical protein
VQEEALKDFVATTLPRSTRFVSFEGFEQELAATEGRSRPTADLNRK